ncbi:MAG TPA: thiamine pyrophosphate-binding protein [Acidimicrobiia bacterium]|nr:thiamine pyrophosphate-binding protein [Acidimicrobiia bacterium]
MRRSGADLVIDSLEALGVEVLFGIVSVHNLPILDALRRRESIRFVTVRHEQAAVHAADAYARVSGRLGVALVSTGPGTANAVPGLYEAAFASSPVLLLTGQVDSAQYGRGIGFLHEAEQQVPMLRTVARRVESVRRTDDIGDTVLRTAADCLTGRPMPGAVEIPIDLQYGPATAAGPAARPAVAPVAPAPRRLDQAAEALRGGARPLIWAGGGVVRAGAGPALVALAEALGAPVVTSLPGRGAIPEDHPLALGPLSPFPEVAAVLADAEPLLAVGTRFTWFDTMNPPLRLPANTIHIDVDPAVIGRSQPAALAVPGDAGLALEGLLARLQPPGSVDEPPPPAGTGVPFPPYSGKGTPVGGFADRAVAAGRAARAAGRQAIGADPAAIMEAIRASLPRPSAVVCDSTVPAYTWGNRLLPVYEPGSFVHPTGGAIGPGLPFALGAALGRPGPAVLIAGDGGFMFHIAELATLAEQQLPVIACVFDDGGFGVLRGVQDQHFRGRIGVDLHTPDFVRVAVGMGVPAARVDSAGAFAEAFAKALAAGGPALISVDMDGLEPIQGMGARRARR